MEYIRHDNTNHWPYIYSENSDANDIHDKGVGFMLTKKAKRFLLEWKPVLTRIITARFDTKFQKTTIIQVFSPTNNETEDDKDDFYKSLLSTINSIPKRVILMFMGDLNAKVGTDKKGRERDMGPNDIGEMNENGEQLVYDKAAFSLLCFFLLLLTGLAKQHTTIQKAYDGHL